MLYSGRLFLVFDMDFFCMCLFSSKYVLKMRAKRGLDLALAQV